MAFEASRSILALFLACSQRGPRFAFVGQMLLAGNDGYFRGERHLPGRRPVTSRPVMSIIRC